jgi:hypothetical protein
MGKRRSSRAADPSPPAGQSFDSQWLLIRYLPVSLFSLRSTYSMSKGGKTLLLPTPYSIKMALIDATFRAATAAVGDRPAREMFDTIKSRRIRIRPPADCVVQNTFVKIRQEERGAASGQYVPTIAYRELVYFNGDLEIAIEAGGWSDDALSTVRNAAMHVNYFGKRGSFVQFVSADVVEVLPEGFSLPDGTVVSEMPINVYGVTQFLDDFGPELCKDKDGFERISTFHDKDIKLEKHRILVSTLIPYRRVEATRSFTRYTRRPVES